METEEKDTENKWCKILSLANQEFGPVAREVVGVNIRVNNNPVISCVLFK